MRKLLYLLLFLFLTLFFLYLTFPFERFVRAELCDRGISYASLKLRRFPLQIELEEVKAPYLPFKVERLTVKPSLLILFKEGTPVKFKAYLCGGKIEGWFTYPLRELSYRLCSVVIGRCVEGGAVDGALSSSGALTFSGRDLIRGVGEFSINDFTLKNLSFGLFSTEKLTFEEVKGTYEVRKKNLVEVEAEGHGKEGSFELKGSLSYNPKEPLSSYASFKIKVKLKKEPFNGKEFNFTVRGNLRELRF